MVSRIRSNQTLARHGLPNNSVFSDVPISFHVWFLIQLQHKLRIGESYEARSGLEQLCRANWSQSERRRRRKSKLHECFVLIYSRPPSFDWCCIKLEKWNQVGGLIFEKLSQITSFIYFIMLSVWLEVGIRTHDLQTFFICIPKIQLWFLLSHAH